MVHEHDSNVWRSIDMSKQKILGNLIIFQLGHHGDVLRQRPALLDGEAGTGIESIMLLFRTYLSMINVCTYVCICMHARTSGRRRPQQSFPGWSRHWRRDASQRVVALPTPHIYAGTRDSHVNTLKPFTLTDFSVFDEPLCISRCTLMGLP